MFEMKWIPKKIIWYEMISDHNHDFHFSAVKTLRSLRPMLFWRKYERDRKQAAVQCSKMFPPPQPALFLTNVTNEAPLSWNSPISSCAQMGPFPPRVLQDMNIKYKMEPPLYHLVQQCTFMEDIWSIQQNYILENLRMWWLNEKKNTFLSLPH